MAKGVRKFMTIKTIKTSDIYVDFQPIVSVNSRRIVGVEALARGNFNGEIIPPLYLFDYAKEAGFTVQLDKICLEKAMMNYAARPVAPMLFLNFDTEVLNEIEPGTGVILKATEEAGLSHKNIVIEINETAITNNTKVKRFIDFYHEKGYLIALDDVGAGYSNLNRITYMKPDIVKIDDALTHEINKSGYRQEVIKSIINLAKKINAFTVAEGVETIEEVITCMMLGVDFFQGFYFSEPKAFNDLLSLNIDEKLNAASESLSRIITKNRDKLTNSRAKYFSLINLIKDSLSACDSLQYEDALLKIVTENPSIECAYLLDENGVQITSTIILEETLNSRQSVLFAPAKKGTRHEVKNYFYAVKECLEDPFLSDTYISNATGHRCKTVSSKFQTSPDTTIIVCVDII